MSDFFVFLSVVAGWMLPSLIFFFGIYIYARKKGAIAFISEEFGMLELFTAAVFGWIYLGFLFFEGKVGEMIRGIQAEYCESKEMTDSQMLLDLTMKFECLDYVPPDFISTESLQRQDKSC